MASKSKNTNQVSNWIIFAAFIAIVALLMKFFRDYHKTVEDDFVSEEGKKILNDPIKTEKLNVAIEHYHKKGSWEKLAEI